MVDHVSNGKTGTPELSIHLPAPTGWPLLLAFGVTLAFAGLVTNTAVSVCGAIFILFGCRGWFLQVLPKESVEAIRLSPRAARALTARRRVEHIAIDATSRARFPLETYPVTAGLKGGIAGGIAMILPALLYGFVAQHSIWYPVNLLGGAGVAHWRNPSTADIAAFHWQGLLVASIIHIVTSLLVGLLYGAMLPMWPRRPVLLGGIVAPLLWTGLLHSSMGLINPALQQRIAWGWFAVSQFAFGVVAGLVVVREERILIAQPAPLIARLGIEAPGLMRSHNDEEQR